MQPYLNVANFLGIKLEYILFIFAVILRIQLRDRFEIQYPCLNCVPILSNLIESESVIQQQKRFLFVWPMDDYPCQM